MRFLAAAAEERDRPPARHRRDTPSTRHYNATQVAEAALVGVPHDVKGSALYAFVTLTPGAEAQASTTGSSSTRSWRPVASMAQELSSPRVQVGCLADLLNH